jgi:SAM-dependent methyltransferase
MKEWYGLPRGYQARLEPAYYHDTDTSQLGIVWQPDVYELAGRLARRLGADQIIDLGCGSGQKLVEIAAGRPVVGFDFGDNLVRAKQAFPRQTWLEIDLEQSGVRLDSAQCARSIVICADVIEHLRDPRPLIDLLQAALASGALAIVLSTPDRIRTHGRRQTGPPPNPHHVREWTLEELCSWLSARGIVHGGGGWTRSHDNTARKDTLVIVITSNAQTLGRCGVDPAGNLPGGFSRLRVQTRIDGYISDVGAWTRRLRRALNLARKRRH